MSKVKQHAVVEPYLDLVCLLGEGPHYDERTKEFRWLDIDGKKIHFLNPTKGPSSLRTIEHPDDKVGVTADIEGNEDEFIFAGETSFRIMNKHTGKSRVVADIWTGAEDAATKSKRCRLNDGNVDPQGRFFAGTMVDPGKDSEDGFMNPGPKTNALCRLDADLSVHRVIEEDVVCPNGVTWTADNKTMYWTDSKFGIFKYEYDNATAAMTNRQLFLQSSMSPLAVPDGHVIDEHDHLWVALYGAGKVVRVNPQGEIVEEILLQDAPKVTCPCFVGTELWITSISHGPGEGKNGGKLFKVDVGVNGKKKHLFKMPK